MKITLYFMRLEDKYWGLFLLGLCVLFYLGRRETRGLLLYSCIASLVCLCPLSAYGLTRLLPDGADYYMLWHIVPAGVVVCVSLTLLYERLEGDKRRQAAFALGVFVLLFFAGEFAYTSQEEVNDDRTGLGREETEVYRLLLEDMGARGEQTASLWGPSGVMADSRLYSGALRPIYGKDIEEVSSDYSQTLRSMYQGYETFASPDSPLENKTDQVEAIANCLNVFEDVSCDYVVLIDPAAQGADVDAVSIFQQLGYVYVGRTETWLVFRR